MPYLRFAAMIATSTVVMFGLMYLNTYARAHVVYSETRTYMAILMGAAMAIIMLGYMLGMYKSKAVNVAIFAGSVVVFGMALWLVRSQATVGGVSYMRSMIPHHSVAILTSNRATITDPRVRALADEIIEAQEREIAEMLYLIADLEDGRPSAALAEDGGETTPVGSVADALDRARPATLDPAPMSEAEAERVLAPDAGCAFSFTEASDPILVARAPVGTDGLAEGVMKINGVLVPLRAEAPGSGLGALVDGATLAAEGVTVVVAPLAGGADDHRRADLVFRLSEGSTVGYRGFYRCAP